MKTPLMYSAGQEQRRMIWRLSYRTEKITALSPKLYSEDRRTTLEEDEDEEEDD